MFLQNIRNEMDNYQIWFQGRSALDKLKTIDISEIDWRMTLILEIMKLAQAFWMQYFNESNNLASIQEIRKLLIQAESYCDNNTICWWKLKLVMEKLSYEIIRDHNWKFDFSMIKDILEWKEDVKNFLHVALDRNIWNTLFWFTWKSWKHYSWKWIVEMAKLKQADIEDIISILKSDTKELQEAIDFYNNPDNTETIKKEFGQIRHAWLSILTQSFSWEVWKFITFVQKINNKDSDKTEKLINELVDTNSWNTQGQEDLADWTWSVTDVNNETQTEEIITDKTETDTADKTVAPF